MATERTVLVRLKAHVSDFQRGMAAARNSMRDLTSEIDTSNNRTTILAQSILGLGPAFVPLTAAAVPVVAGLSTQLLVAGAAAGTAVLAFAGIGQGLKALNDYQLKPTAENLLKMQVEMEKLGPAGEHFVRFLDDVGGQFRDLQLTARAGMFPGMEEGITHLLTLLPKVQVIVGRIAQGMGDLAAEGGQNLAGPKFAAFFDFLRDDAQPILIQMGRTLGNFTEGLANMVVAFAPMSKGFSSGLLDMSRAFAEWSRNLDSNQSFQDFLAYIQQAGPHALSFLGALIKALAAIVEAAAPVGQVLLPAMTALLNVITALAETPLAPFFIAAVSAISLFARAQALAEITTGGFFGKLTSGWRNAARAAGSASLTIARDANIVGTTMLTAGARTEAGAIRMRTATGRLASLGKVGGGIALLAVALSGVAEKAHLANTANLALMGSLAGPWGAAIGAGVGLVMDFSHASDNAKASTDAFNKALKGVDIKPLQDKIDQINSSGIKPLAPDAPRFTGGRGVQPGQYIAARKAADDLAAAQKRINEITDMKNARIGAANLALLADGTRLTAAGMRSASQGAADYSASLEHLNAVISGAQSMIDYERAIDAATKSLKENGKTLDINTEKGRANKESLLGIATSAIQVAKGMERTKGIKFLDGVRNDLIAAARQMGLTRREANRLADRLLGVDKIKARPTIDVQKRRAESDIAAMRARLRELGAQRPSPKVNAEIADLKRKIAEAQRLLASLRDKEVTITTHLLTIQNKPRAPQPGSGGNADGGIPVGPVFKGAVYGPGGPRDDLVHALLSNGEHVLTAEEVARMGGHAAVYAMRAAIMGGMIPAFANGGGVDRARTTVSVAAPRFDLGGVNVLVRLPDGRTERGRVEQVVSGRGELLDARRRDGVRTP